MKSQLSEGSQFGQYRIRRLLGRGGMGAVYEAEHTTLDRRYALKLLPEDFATRPEATARSFTACDGHGNMTALVNAARSPGGQLENPFSPEMRPDSSLKPRNSKQRTFLPRISRITRILEQKTTGHKLH